MIMMATPYKPGLAWAFGPSLTLESYIAGEYPLAELDTSTVSGNALCQQPGREGEAGR